VVDVLHGGCKRRGPAIEIEPFLESGERAHRRRGADAFWTVGEEVGVALVQPGDGVAQPVLGEDLEPSSLPLRVDLDQNDCLVLVGADIELSAGYPAR